ncbi:MAG: D-tyrosyl-tRNA(Tyr) deacylase [Bacteroidia bacterium]|nr:D-tyrosyl-tRNA(Tyr) deacylase [Bacteroidia bacterium]NNF31611.1 D-tyrosyl-tRNA(Tyr) deacylase [Flavobacteriaceae bacterium]NNJ83247.1 D-tyrosyl-tRNA(Tyr) deacylase [Flavobacteriaceae bacterium]NNK53301.1 D-tyrosyl-tRNA(Tyr) deacylase [Flavobacteriaceae bacterium]
MRAVIQRVKEASVSVDAKVISEIGSGFLILLGVETEDTPEDISWLAGKIARLRVFSDDRGAMNKSIQESGGDIIVVSQFTLHASTKKGNRPSFIKAARPDMAVPMYETFVSEMAQLIGKDVYTGEFGAMMDVSLVNDGPVTIVIDSKIKE